MVNRGKDLGFTAAVIGQSFISGLLAHLSGRHDTISHHQVARKLRLHDLVSTLHLIGERGVKVTDNSFRLPLEDLNNVNPEILVMNYGTNDLASGVAPINVAVKVVDLAQLLYNEITSIKTITICSAIPRAGNYHMSEHNMESAIFDFNKYLSNLWEVEDNINYQVQTGYWRVPIQVWSRDRIHPNTLEGRLKMRSNLKSAIFKAVDCIMQSNWTRYEVFPKLSRPYNLQPLHDH